MLSRRIGEVLNIHPNNVLPPDMTVVELFSDGQIAIEVLEIKGTQVRIGIDVPKQLTILRDNTNE